MAIGRGAFAVVLAALVAVSGIVTEQVLAQAGAEIRQRDIAFEPDRIEIKVGDTLLFVNDDPFAHNVFSDSPAGPFDIGRQTIGTRTPVTFRRAGNVEVRCRIHPKMRLVVTVSS
jgi:plastocyanin